MIRKKIQTLLENADNLEKHNIISCHDIHQVLEILLDPNFAFYYLESNITLVITGNDFNFNEFKMKNYATYLKKHEDISKLYDIKYRKFDFYWIPGTSNCRVKKFRNKLSEINSIFTIGFCKDCTSDLMEECVYFKEREKLRSLDSLHNSGIIFSSLPSAFYLLNNPKIIPKIIVYLVDSNFRFSYSSGYISRLKVERLKLSKLKNYYIFFENLHSFMLKNFENNKNKWIEISISDQKIKSFLDEESNSFLSSVLEDKRSLYFLAQYVKTEFGIPSVFTNFIKAIYENSENKSNFAFYNFNDKNYNFRTLSKFKIFSKLDKTKFFYVKRGLPSLYLKDYIKKEHHLVAKEIIIENLESENIKSYHVCVNMSNDKIYKLKERAKARISLFFQLIKIFKLIGDN